MYAGKPVFAQLTCRKSLRDIEACLSAQPARPCRGGIGGTVSLESRSPVRLMHWRRLEQKEDHTKKSAHRDVLGKVLLQ